MWLIDCEQSLNFLLRHGIMRPRVRGKQQDGKKREKLTFSLATRDSEERRTTL